MCVVGNWASRPRRFGTVAAALGALAAGWSDAVAATDLINEPFATGFDPAVFEPIGDGVVLEWDSAAQDLRVRVENEGDGFRINIPQDLPGDPTARCLALRQEISNLEFIQGTAWLHRVIMVDSHDPTHFVCVELIGERSFWNRCLYKLRNGDTEKEVGFLAPQEGATAKWECPGIKDVTFDWLPPEMKGGLERIQIEVSSDAAGDCQFKTTKPSPIVHDPGGGGEPPANAFRITAWEVVGVRENPEFGQDECG